MAPAPRRVTTGLLICCCMLQLLCSSQQISTSSGSEAETADVIVLRDTVTVTGRLTVGQKTVEASSSSTQRRTVIDCSQLQGKPAYLIRQGDFTLQNVILQGCTHQAVVLIGPGASLTAYNVTFSGHGTSSSSNRSQEDSNSSSSRVQGVVISAQQATVILDRVLITGNEGALSHGAPLYHPPCNSSNVLAPASTNGIICNTPVLVISLIHLQNSTLTARDTTIAGNTAGAVISTSGSAQHSLQLLSGTQLQDNTAAWLIVADSFGSDAVGRANMLAPHPSEKNAKQKLQFRPAYTTYDFMWHVKSMVDWRKVLAQQVAHPKVLQYVGRAPSGQSPLQLQVRNASISRNTVTRGLMWLRLVNTSMHDVNISSNIAVNPAGTTDAAAAAAAVRGAAAVAGRLASGMGTQPPHLCDMGALEGALLQVQGAAAFDMFRCNVSHNVHPTGAIIRVSDGVALSSIRSSILSDNVATAVLRIDGRSWVHDAVVFMNATQATDSSFYRQAEGTSEETYKTMWLPKHHTEQANYDKVSTDTACFVMNSRIERNAAFHAVVLAKGERVDWRSYEYAKARAALAKNGSLEAAADVTMETFNAANWWSGNIFASNTFIPAATSAPMQGVEAALYLNALSFVLSGSRKSRSEWANRTVCEAALRPGSLENTTKIYNIKPAVFAGTFGTNFLAGTFEANVGFPHVVSMHSVTLVGSLTMRGNVVNTSVLRIMDASAGLYNSTLENNRVQVGSVLQGDSFVGRFEQVTIAGNQAAFDHPQQALNNSSAQGLNADAGASAEAGAVISATKAGATGAKWPIMGLQRIDLGILRNVTVANNTAPFWNLAIESNQWNFLEDVVGLVIHNNSASGIRLNRLQPYYDRQGWVMRDSRITGNTVTQEAGAILLEGFNSRVGTVMPIALDNCVITNNTPAHGSQAPPKGGGIAIQGPTDDRADGSSDRGFLEFLNISISNSLIEGNMASEGGGVWSAWPMLVANTTVRGNTAENAGGGLFLRGLQQDKLGLGNVVVVNSSISNNTAVFGGAIACDSCRAFLYGTNVSGNRAVSRLSVASAAGTNSSSACSNNSSGGHGSVGNNDSCLLAAGQQQQGASPPVKGAVLGAGGAFAAVLKDRSFLRVCGASANQPAAVTKNQAETVGGLMYMQYQGTSACSAGKGVCTAAAQFGCTAGNDPSAQVFSQSSLCGVQLHNIDWSGTHASNVGHVLAWAAGQQQPPFSMHCHAQAGNGGSSSRSGISSSAANCGCGEGFAAAHRRPGMPYLGPASNMTERLMWQLPNQMSVMHTGCLMERSNASRNSSDGEQLERCLLADGKAVLPAAPTSAIPAPAAGGRLSNGPYATFAGNAVNLTVALTRGLPDSRFNSAAIAARIAPCSNSTDPVTDAPPSNLAAVELQQDRTGGLFVIGKSRAVLDTSGLARFCNMALQPTEPPLYNRNYSFSIQADTSSGLLAQVPAVEVTVQLLRCTLGQHMTINRCVRCAESGTFSLHPNRSCQPCVPGALCSRGLLQPQEGFWSYNPFVPQVIPCPLQGACADRPITDEQLKLMVPWAAQAWQQQQHHASAEAAVAVKGVSSNRQLLQDLVQQLHDNHTTTTTSSSSSGSNDSTQKQWDRAGALEQYNKWLADLITYDSEQGPFRLYNVTYKGLLDSWQQVQCNRGYKGYMCSSCDAAYVDPDSGSSSTSAQPRRFAFHRNRCVDCSTSIGATWFMLCFLFLLFLGYVSLGIFCQIRSVDRDALQADPATHTVDASSSRGNKSSDSNTLPCWQKCWSGPSSTTAEVTGAAAVAGKGKWASSNAPACTKPQQQLEGHHAAASDAAVCIGDMDRDQIQRQGRAGQGVFEPASEGAACVVDTSPAAAEVATAAAADAGQAGPGSGMTTTAAANAGPAAKGAQQQAAGGPAAGVPAAAAGGVSGAGASSVHTLVAMWKVLTSYVQILAMVRFLPSLWDTAAPLQFADLSSFSQFAAFDCILPGPADKLAHTRILLTAFGVPALLFVVFLIAWITRWGLHQLGAALYQHAISRSSVSGHSSAQSMPAAVPSSAVSVSAAGNGSVQAPPHATAEACPRVPVASRTESAHSTVSLESASGRTSSANSSRSLGSWLQSAASSVVQNIPAAALARLQTFGAKRPPVSLRRYLSTRLTITAVVLGYSCYSLFTSQMLQTLACHPIREVAGSQNAAAGYGFGDSIKDFGDLHSRWLWERWHGLQAVLGSRDLALEMPALCQGPAGAAEAGTCQVSGQFWKQDYSVQCFQGSHAVMAGFGAVLLVLVGVFLPVLFGLLLWRNKGRLKEPLFSAKYSFLYHEYREQVCYWEFAIMARKLAFLGIFVALNPPRASPESVMLLQLYVAAALAVVALLLNVFLQPFELAWLNHLECAGLTAITLTFLLLGASVTLSSSPGGRLALLVLTGVGNFALVCYFVWHMCKIVWEVFGGVVVTYLASLQVRLSRAWHGQGRQRGLGCLP